LARRAKVRREGPPKKKERTLAKARRERRKKKTYERGGIGRKGHETLGGYS